MEKIKRIAIKIFENLDRIIYIIEFSTIYMFPLALLAAYMGMHIYMRSQGADALNGLGHLITIFIAIIINALCFLVNLLDYIFNKQRDFSIKTRLGRNPTANSKYKNMAMYPAPSFKYRSLKKEGMIFGKYGLSYIRYNIDPNNILSGCIIGTPGSGKSVFYLAFLLLNFWDKAGSKDDGIKEPPLNTFVMDIKPELCYKSVEMYENPYVVVCNPRNRDSYGWDLYSSISADSNDDTIIQLLNAIVSVLVPKSGDKNHFFDENSKKILIGFLYYYFKCGMDFIESVVEIQNVDIASAIKNILKDTKRCPKGSIPRSYLAEFEEAESNAFNEMKVQVKENLHEFLLPDIQYYFSENPLKAAPEMLNEDKSIFLAFPDDALETLPNSLAICTATTLLAMQKRKESAYGGSSSELKPVLLILDEFGRLPVLPKIEDILTTGRSKKISCWFAFQDISQLKKYGDTGISIFNMCEIHAIYACRDTDTIAKFSAWAGHYKEEKLSITDGKEAKTTKSKERLPVLEAKDFLSLRKTCEVILFLEGEYMRVRKFRYYMDPVLLKRSLDVQRLNKEAEE